MKEELNLAGKQVSAIIEGSVDALKSASIVEQVKTQLLSPTNINFAPEIRKARLYTEFTIDGEKFEIELYGTRSCDPTAERFAKGRDTKVVDLTCDLTYFANEDTPLGSMKVIQDPRFVTKGWIYLNRTKEGRYQLPGLSYFNQHSIFHIGDRFFYYPRAWQVVSPILAWPPEYSQYHHLEEDTPVFDYLTGEPDVARKGISTISIEGEFTPEEEAKIRAEFAKELEVIKALPPSKMEGISLTLAQADPRDDIKSSKRK